MPRSLRTAAALLAAYVIALQTLLSGVVVAAHAGATFITPVCTSGGSTDKTAPPRHQQSDCAACPLVCGGSSPAVMPSGVAFRVSLGGQGQLAVLVVEALPSPGKHQPQAARAPPIEV